LPVSKFNERKKERKKKRMKERTKERKKERKKTLSTFQLVIFLTYFKRSSKQTFSGKKSKKSLKFSSYSYLIEKKLPRFVLRLVNDIFFQRKKERKKERS
jgi:hypothetical protein